MSRRAIQIISRGPTRISPSRPFIRQYASASPISSLTSKLRHALNTTLILGGSAALIVYYYDSRSAIHEHVIMPAIRATMDAEESHRMAVKALAMSSWLRPSDVGKDGEELKTEIFGLELDNPVGLAAGFDKDAEAIDGLFDLGFGYVEIGSVTPEPQPGNPKPRFFRLLEDNAAINRYGFNSLGHRQALHRLQSRIREYAISNPSLFPEPLPLNPLPPSNLPRSLRKGKLLAVNLGKNKTSKAESNEDYLQGVRMLGPYADILVVNVSSPNTPGLRGLQGKDFLGKLLREVVEEKNKLKVDGDKMKPKVVVKVAPDLDGKELEDIAGAVRMSGVDGVIVSNTTIKREGLGLQSEHSNEVGGLSGAPLKPLSLLALSTLRTLLPPSIPLIGCGGISTGLDALEFASSGASLIQSYTSFGYRGVGYPRLLKDEISEVLKKENMTWKEYVKIGELKWHEGLERTESDLEEEANKLKTILQEEGVKAGLKTNGKGKGVMSVKEMEEAVKEVLKEASTSKRKQITSSSTRAIENASTPSATVSSADPANSTTSTPRLPSTASEVADSISATSQSPIAVVVPPNAFNQIVAAGDNNQSLISGSRATSAQGERGRAEEKEMPDVDEWTRKVKFGTKRLV